VPIVPADEVPAGSWIRKSHDLAVDGLSGSWVRPGELLAIQLGLRQAACLGLELVGFGVEPVAREGGSVARDEHDVNVAVVVGGDRVVDAHASGVVEPL
jgi:hypothetical protein